MRVLFLSIGAVGVVLSILFGIRMYGLAKPVLTYDSPYMKWEGVAAVIPWDPDTKVDSNGGIIVWAQIFENEEKELDVVSPSNPEARRTLKEFLAETAGSKVVLDVRSNTENIDLKISDAIPATEDERVLIQSPYDVVLRALKKLRPRMVFGSSAADETRMLMMSSLYILPAAPLQGDVFWSALSPATGVSLQPEVVSEVHRRHKKVFIGPLKTRDEVEKALAFGPDALVLESFDLMLHLRAAPPSR